MPSLPSLEMGLGEGWESQAASVRERDWEKRNKARWPEQSLSQPTPTAWAPAASYWTHLLAPVLAPAVFDGPEGGAVTWKVERSIMKAKFEERGLDSS